MSYTASFAGINLHEYVDILSVKRNILPVRTNFTQDIPSMNGYYYINHKYGEKVITLSCLIKAKDRVDYLDTIRELSFILDVNQPKKLIIGDQPDVYFNAIPSANGDIEKFIHNGSFSIDFICYNPYGYSLETDEFVANEKKIISVENSGTTDTQPIVNVGFNKEAYFLQCTNYTGETILVGTPPTIDVPKAPFDPEVLNDSCEVLTNWTSVGNVLDTDRSITGNLTINGGGYAICLGNSGSSSSWHGGALRRNLSTSLSEFKLEIKLEHNSKGDLKGVGATTTPPITSGETATSVKYTITAEPSLRIREGRSTSTKQLGSIKTNVTVDVSDISNGWGYVNYNGVKGYIYMQYTKIYTEPVASASAQYKITASSGLRLRSGRGTNYSKLLTIPYNTTVTVSDISSGWGATSYNGKSGYISMQYASKVSSSRTIDAKATDEDSCENRIGMIELYGFDSNGNKLFKACMKDAEEFYEYSEPEVYFGNSLVLDDNKKCPSPKTETEKDSDGKDVEGSEKSVDSGRFGDWNEFNGWFTIQRTISNGKQYWHAKVQKLGDNGIVERAIETQTLNGSYPTGSLSNIVLFIGGYGDKPVVDVMCVDQIKITNLGEPPEEEEIQPIFKKGDELLINFSTQKVYKNGILFMKDLDIGSEFFSCPVGKSEFICKSDDETIDVTSVIQKKWL